MQSTKMKLFLANCLFLFLAASLTAATDPPSTTKVTVPTTTTPQPGPCPTDLELKKVGCLCYPDPLYLICEGTKDTLLFERKYSFNTLVIRNSPTLPFWSEHLSHRDNFTVQSLIVIQSKEKVTITDNFDDLLQLPSKAIKVVTDGAIRTLDLTNMRRELQSVSVTGVPKLVHGDFASFNFGEENTLESLRLNKVGFVPALDNLVLNGLPLRVVEILNSDLKGVVSVVPSQCPKDEERVVISLQGNPGLTGFSFADLFSQVSKANCTYHIDLSNNPSLDPKILNSNTKTLNDHGKQLFIHLAGTELDCSCELYKLYNSKLRDNIHSVKCKNVGYLDQFPVNDNNDKKFKC